MGRNAQILRPRQRAGRPMELFLGVNAPYGPWSKVRLGGTLRPMRSAPTTLRARYALAATLVATGIASIQLSAGVGWTLILVGVWFAAHTAQSALPRASGSGAELGGRSKRQAKEHFGAEQ